VRSVVLVKHVPDAQASSGFTADGFADRTGDGLLSELDEYPLEAARQLAETVGCEVVALSIGPRAARDSLRRALQMGADSAVLITDEALRGSDATVTARVIARAVEQIGEVDLVLCGAASADAGTSIVPVQVAALLGIPALTFASALDVTDGTVTIRRDEDRATVTMSAPMPALVSLTDRADPPRYPSFAQIVKARRKVLTEWDLGTLGLTPVDVGSAASWTRVLTTAPGPPRPPGRMITDHGDAGAELIEFLAARDLI
jgi:electron transfer flavoprotein beta subunit